MLNVLLGLLELSAIVGGLYWMHRRAKKGLPLFGPPAARHPEIPMGMENREAARLAAALRRLEATPGGEEGLAELLAICGDTEVPAMVRTKAFTRLAGIGGRGEPHEVVWLGLADAEQNVRAAASKVLFNRMLLSSNELFELAERRPDVLLGIVEACGRRFDRLATGHVTMCLSDERAEIRLAAIEALGNIGSEGALKSIGGGRWRGAEEAAAKRAMVRIRARLGGGPTAALSLVEEKANEGGLSLGVEAGSLAIEEEEGEEQASERSES